ncbi:Multidrug resistance protein stp [Streptomyces sp. YIM 130001]|uniref:MFS transporter n=1 Tax=Streptomyces sp. YIM 130001 TaxID=2259644 RepID=UPI000E64EDDC|nr:MFS transporter [Streptomyces sp. YIM 130001]RII14707.1 Multidrug resistance protein stp [Streptomyces sp. YIM 130001]
MNTPTARAAPAEAADPRSWKALGVCLTAGFMTLLDTSIVNVALPSVERSLHATGADLSWVVSGYALGFGLALVPGGRLGDLHGRRTMFLTGLTLFTLASAACGFAPGAGWLVVCRLLQGVAAGMVSPQVSGLIQQMFQGPLRARAFGMLGSVVAVSTAAGPLAGGLIIAVAGPEQGWRWVFFVNLPIGIAAIVAGRRLLPRTVHTTARRPGLDPAGLILLATGVVAVLLPLLQEQRWTGRGKWLLIGVGVLLLAAFWRWQRRQDAHGAAPLVAPQLFAQRSFSLGALLGLIYFSGFTTLFFVYTLFLQNGHGFSALQAGLAATPVAAGSAVAANVGGRLVVRFGRRLVAWGLVCVAVGLVGTIVVVQLVPGRSVAWAAAVPLLLAGAGSGLVISPNVTLTLSKVPVSLGSSASGVLQTGQRIGSAAGIAAVGAVFFAHVAHHGDWAGAFQLGLVTSLALVLLALVVALVDLRGTQPE